MKNPFGYTEEKFVKKVLKDGYSIYLAFIYATLDPNKVLRIAERLTATMNKEERDRALKVLQNG